MNNEQTGKSLVAVSRIGIALWTVRHCGRSIGFYHAVGDANRAAKMAIKLTPDHTAQFAEACR